MSRTPVALAALLLLLTAPAARAACTLNLRFVSDPPTLVWDDIGGVKTYQIQESFDQFMTSRNFFFTTPPFAIQHRASAEVKAYYSVTAIMQSNVLSVAPSGEGCTEQIIVTLKADARFRALTRKAVVPVVGSTAGAFGGRFKTALKLTSNAAGERGRVIFHPAGTVGRPDDPSMPYGFGGSGEELFVDDVVGAMGQTGIGTLDIVPDESASDSVPTVEARLYNDTPAGTYGTTESAYYPFDFLHPPPWTAGISATDSRFRINIGLRTLTVTRARALVYGTNGRLREFRELEWPADYMTLGTFKQVLGIDLQPGESVTLFFDGAVIPFHTRTENRTNDPELFVAGAAHSPNVGSYVE